ncbi:MAG: hypothetical protein ACJ79E_09250 [Anaeromyxobacteraceae bacterium]
MKRSVFIIAVLVLAGCGGERAALEAHRERWAAERRSLEDAFDQLEERLLTDQARVHFWNEMRDRHESVSAVACTNLDRHADGIALLQDRSREKRDAAARKNRVASRFVPPADVVSEGAALPAADDR